MLVLTSYKSLLLDLVLNAIGAGAWLGLLVKTFVTIIYGCSTLMIYAGLAQVIGIF